MKDNKNIETENKLSSDFCDRLKIARGELHFSQKDFAAKLDISASYLSEIESGKTRPGFEFFYKVSKIFKINPVYLLHGDEPIFLEKEKSWYHNIDFGSLNREVQELIKYMEQSPTVAHAMLEFFSRYLYNNRDLIDAEIKRNREK